jgi:hypothetical protein
VVKPLNFLVRDTRARATGISCFFSRGIAHMQAAQSGNQMGTKFWEMVCDENGIGGDGVYCGDSRPCARVAARRVLSPGKPRKPKRMGHYTEGAEMIGQVVRRRPHGG